MRAEVVKIENIENGDETRLWGPPFVENKIEGRTYKESCYFLSVNRNKKSVCVDFKSTIGVELLHTLVKDHGFDVIIENYSFNKLKKYKLDYKSLSKINPNIIYGSITGYGQTGPYKNRPGYDVITEAEGGLMHITGKEDGPPVKVGIAITDITTGLYMHGAIMTALYNREKTGKGEYIDASLLNCQLSTLTNLASSFLNMNIEPKRMGTQHPSIVPYQTYNTKDGKQIVIGANNDSQFKQLCLKLDLESLSGDQFATNQKRVENRKALNQILQTKLSEFNQNDIIKLLSNTNVAIGPVNNFEESFSHPQIIHNKLVKVKHHPKLGKIKLIDMPLKYKKNKAGIRFPPPILGQHTLEVLKKTIGLKQQHINILTSLKIVK